MKIIGINGSPRTNGNTAAALETFLMETEANGAKTKTYHLNQMDIKGCQSCYACRKEGREGQCGVKDDMPKLLNEILEADAVVLASPVYMWQMTAQAKAFTDRLFPLLKPDYSSRLNGQKLISIYTQGNPDKAVFADYFEHTRKMFSFLGFRTMPTLVAAGIHQPGDYQNKANLINTTKQSAQGLLMADCM
jgi:multimeric flavodoxin WrbA